MENLSHQIATKAVVSKDKLYSFYTYCLFILLFLMISEYKIRRGPTFGPVKYAKEVSHVKHMHADSFLIHPNFSSKFMITWFNLFENPLLIRFQIDRKLNFDPVRTNDHVIDQLIENSLLTWFELMRVDQKWNFEQLMIT